MDLENERDDRIGSENNVPDNAPDDTVKDAPEEDAAVSETHGEAPDHPSDGEDSGPRETAQPEPPTEQPAEQSAEQPAEQPTEQPAPQYNAPPYYAPYYTPQPTPQPNGGNAVPAKQPKKRNGWKIALAVIAVVLILVLLLTGPLAVAFALLKLRAQDGGQNAPGDRYEDTLPPDKPNGGMGGEERPDYGEQGKNYKEDDWVNPGNLDDENAIVNVAAKCSPSVVTVQITTMSGSGSGVIWSEDGYIVTNNHVVEDAETVRVVLANGDTHPASVIDTDAENDLALLRINASGLPPVSVGESATLKVGQTAIVIGNPLGTLANSVTSGIISALARDINVEGTVMNVMQTTAAINLGNSGGGCFDINGNLIGIVNAKKYATGVEGLGFAIPVDTVKTVISGMVAKDDKVLRKSMGITAQEANESSYAQLRSRYSIYRTVESLNGAPLYGIYIVNDDMVNYVDSDVVFEQFDIIRTVNGEEVLTFEDLDKIIGDLNVGDVMTVEVTRVVTTTSGYRQTRSLKNFTITLKVIEMYR